MLFNSSPRQGKVARYVISAVSSIDGVEVVTSSRRRSDPGSTGVKSLPWKSQAAKSLSVPPGGSRRRDMDRFGAIKPRRASCRGSAHSPSRRQYPSRPHR